MWEIVNTIKPDAWNGMGVLLTAFISGVGMAIVVVRKGLKASPQQAGTPPPKPDRTEYVIAELRTLVHAVKGLRKEVDEISHRTEALRRDTGIILDRLNRP